MPYKLASLLLSAEQKSNSIAKISWAEADHGDEANELRFTRVGKIFSLVEINATNAKAKLLLDFFSERPKLNYYGQLEIDKNEYPSPEDLEKLFTTAIQETNHDLIAFLEEHKIRSVQPEISVTIGLLTEKKLFLASIGHNQAWLLLPTRPNGQQVIKIIGVPRENEIGNNYFFQEIISGIIPNHSYCLISNEALAEYIEPATALNLLANKPPLIGAEKLKNFLQQTNRRVDFLGLIIKRVPFSELQDNEQLAAAKVYVQPTTSRTQLIGSNLQLTEEQTEKILNPSGWSKLSSILKTTGTHLWQWLMKLIHRPWADNGRSCWQHLKHKVIAIQHKIQVWPIWSSLSLKSRQLLCWIKSLWYKTQPKFQSIGQHIAAWWFKTAPWRCRIVEKWWWPIERRLRPIKNRLSKLRQRVAHCFRYRCGSHHSWRNLKKRSRIFLLLFGLCLLLLIGGIAWQHQRQISQAKLQEQIDQLASVDQKHKQIEANLLYNNLTAANQNLDEAGEIIKKWQETQPKISKEINERWQQAVAEQEKLIGEVRHIYTLRNGEIITGQPNIIVTSSDKLLGLSSQLMAWVNNSEKKIVYQNDQREWQTTSWPEDWEEISAMTADDNNWYFATASGQLASLNHSGQWKLWSLPEPVKQIKALALFGGRLYLIDENNQIRRYDIKEDTLVNGQKWNTDPLPVGEIAGLAINGQVYVFYRDGQAFKLNNGRKQNFTITASEPSLTGWSSCQLSSDGSSFDCLESGGSRIIIYKLDGTILSQYLLADISARAMTINHKDKIIYTLTNEGIKKFIMP